MNPFTMSMAVLGQMILPQRLGRIPEPAEEMCSDESVEQFNTAAPNSRLALSYAKCLEIIHCCLRTRGGIAIDLCCGPGHFSLLLAKYFGFRRVIGVDLSEAMIEKARINAEAAGLDNVVEYAVGNALAPDTLEPFMNRCDLVSCNDAMHHMNDEESTDAKTKVRSLFKSMDSLCSPTGIAVAMDLARLKTPFVNALYSSAISDEYRKNGWDQFSRDFENSMVAAWTIEEITQMMPKETEHRKWQQIVPRLMPFNQFVIGVPNDQMPIKVRQDKLWSKELQPPIPRKFRPEWWVFRNLFSI